MQANLLSNIRSNPDQPLLFNYSNLQHLRGYQPRLPHSPAGNLPQISMRLEQNEARIWTHMFQSASLENGGHTINTYSIFDTKDINREIGAACKRFIDSLYNRSDHTHFVGSFVDAYDIFISGVFYIQLEQEQGSSQHSIGRTSDHLSGQQERLGVINDMVNKCCTLIAGIESRFGAVKTFRRVLRDFFALTTRQSHPESAESVSMTFANRVASVVYRLDHLGLIALPVFIELARYYSPTDHLVDMENIG